MSRIDQLLKYLSEDPSDVFVLYSLAQEYLKDGDSAKALEYFVRLKQTDPEYVGMFYHLGKLYEALGQPEQAKLTYEEGISVASSKGDIHAAGELRGALDLLETTLED